MLAQLKFPSNIFTITKSSSNSTISLTIILMLSHLLLGGEEMSIAATIEMRYTKDQLSHSLFTSALDS